jgi:dienelactone hydrolase
MGGTWPTADPSKAGPFETTTENDVGPAAGVTSADDDTPVQFTLFRPSDLAQGDLCHPVITWGDGHGTTPSLYSSLLTRMASHGFIVIASNSSAVSQGSPAPMLAGVTWVLERNEDPTSVLYQRIDTTRVGATGHSEGAGATASAGANDDVLTIAPICGGGNARNLHGPALLLCGGQDTTLPCSGSISALDSITTQPALVANYLTATHTNWITRGNAPSPMEVAALAWMRVQLMGDTTLKPMFYGEDCTLCTDSAWDITQNPLMNQ